MGDLSKLKIAVGQPELAEFSASRNLAAKDRMVSLAVEAGADLLVMPGSLSDGTDIHLVALNDSRIDVAGSVVVLEACGETYHIGLGSNPQACDFAVFADVEPWTMQSGSQVSRPGVIMRPVGMRNIEKRVLAYDGGTCVRSASGQLLASLRDDFEEDFALVSLSEKTEIAQPCKDKLLAALVKTVRRFDEQVLSGSAKWIIGLSGGLDSTIVAALLTLALGQERVLGYNLSTDFNTQATKANAASVAEALGIEMKSGSISDLVAATELVAEQFGYTGDGGAALSGIALENVQARVRGHLLSTFASLEGGVVVNNGNRVESALGYATLYGDSIGALAPIADLTKTRLFELANVINGAPGVGIIPESLLPKVTEEGYEWEVMPSAELSDDQVDPMKWFYHDWLIEKLLDSPTIESGACEVLEGYLEDRFSDSPVSKWVRFYGLDDPSKFIEDFDWIMASMRDSAFKRIQAPPAIRVASTASIASEPEVQGKREPSATYKDLHLRVSKLKK